MVNVGIIGLGFMGRTHLAAYQRARDEGFECRVVAVADKNVEAIVAGAAASGSVGNFKTGAGSALFDPSETNTFSDATKLINDPSVHAVSICTHTDTHVPLAQAAMLAGKHVLCEKPVALKVAEIEMLAALAKKQNVVCMPAMCMRYWPGWSWLKERVLDGSLGKVRSAVFQRLGSPPDWGTDFYRDIQRTGGPLVDLHIHDADFVRFLFGQPRGVISRGGLMHGTTLYDVRGAAGVHDAGAHVMAEWGQDHHPGFGFKMRYVVVFDHATADFDIGRDPALLLCRDGKSEPVTLPPGSGYDHEIRHFVQAVLGHASNEQLTATIDDAIEVAKLLELERASLSGQ